jgi:nicotinamidase-related amidase
MPTALIIVDIQNDYFPGGRMTLHEMERAAENAARLLARFRDTGQKTFHIQHTWGRPVGSVLRCRHTGRGHSRVGRSAAR